MPCDRAEFRPGAVRGNLHGGGQEYRALRGAACLARGYRLDREPEEAGEPDGLSRGGHLFKRPPEDLRPDIDAEDRLEIWSLSRPAASQGGELGEELPPGGDLVGPLPEQLGSGGRRGARRGLRVAGRGGEGHRWEGVLERTLVDQPDGEQMPQGVVLFPVQSFFMGEEFQVTGPAADAEQ